MSSPYISMSMCRAISIYTSMLRFISKSMCVCGLEFLPHASDDSCVSSEVVRETSLCLEPDIRCRVLHPLIASSAVNLGDRMLVIVCFPVLKVLGEFFSNSSKIRKKSSRSFEEFSRYLETSCGRNDG